MCITVCVRFPILSHNSCCNGHDLLALYTSLKARREGGHRGQDGERKELPDAGVVPHGGLRRGHGGDRRREHQVYRSGGASVKTHDHTAGVYCTYHPVVVR